MGVRHPVYYCPPGVDRPDHIRAEAPNRLVDGAGPDQLGGVTYGGIFSPEQVWHHCEPGWWVCLDGVTTRDLLRTSAIAGMRVRDAEGRDWMVPRLLDGEAAAVGYWTPTGFAVPVQIAELVDQLRGLLDYRGKVTLEMAQLAARLIEQNYHATIHEHGIWRTFTPEVVWQVVGAGSGIPPERVLAALA